MTTTLQSYEQRVSEDLGLLLQVLPADVREAVMAASSDDPLLEIVLDLGRQPEARFSGRTIYLLERPVTHEDIDTVTDRVGVFGKDNRAGVERTLHRISAIRNRAGRVIGLTCRVGRAVYGTIDIMRDVVEAGKSVLILGRPGVGKTTKLREVARVLSEATGRRVVIVDTSNEIAGDGDIPHPAIGRARRMQVPEPALQHAVMIEAVENHMPQVIVIDEIGTEQEAFAARTIAERGVQLVGTAHGNTLENLLVNPTLSDLIGGIQAVTLGDDEARRRGTQKTVLERKAPPTFDVVIEMIDQDRMAIHPDVSSTVDDLLRGKAPRPEIRERKSDGNIRVLQEAAGASWVEDEPEPSKLPETVVRVPSRAGDAECPVISLFPYGVSRNRLEKAIRDLRVPCRISRTLQDADMVLALKSHYRRDGGRVREALSMNKPTWSVRSNTQMQIEGVLRQMFTGLAPSESERALQETDDAISRVLRTGSEVDLSPQNSALRRLQHQRVEEAQLHSVSVGEEPNRRIRISRA